MIRHAPRNRAGITLVEILIAIMIMGVGLVSLATLFPLGLIRLRDAQRFSRSTLLAETASNDLSSRNLLQLESFQFSWYFTIPGFPTVPYGINPSNNRYTPWSHEVWLSATNTPAVIVYDTGPSFPVAYDPLWWSVMHQQTLLSPDPNLGTISPQTSQARFASGLGFLRPDPDGGAPSAHGLQRITNFAPVPNPSYALPVPPANLAIPPSWPFVYPNPAAPANSYASILPDVTGDIFTSRDDIVMQSDKGSKAGTTVASQRGVGSPLVPANFSTLAGGFASQNDWSYTWMFTGHQLDVNDPTQFQGDIVVFHNRPIAIETVTSPYGGQVSRPMGERVVEALFGPFPSNANTVILRWPATEPDPDIRAGNWIADVTYERTQALNASRFTVANQAPQRCYWYQVAKRQLAAPATACSTDIGPYRQMTLTLTNPVRVRTQMNFNVTPAQPVHVNAALLNSSVVNVFPTTVN
jgi:type II secretory pathway pseudopilin PulG